MTLSCTSFLLVTKNCLDVPASPGNTPSPGRNQGSEFRDKCSFYPTLAHDKMQPFTLWALAKFGARPALLTGQVYFFAFTLRNLCSQVDSPRR